MELIVGRIDDVSAEPGIRPRLRLSLAISNRNAFAIGITQMTAKASVSFSQDGRIESPGTGSYIGEVGVENIPWGFAPGDSNFSYMYLPIGMDVLSAIETQRQGRDIAFQVTVSIVGFQRDQNGATTGPMITTALTDSRSQGNQYVTTIIAKSRWRELLDQIGFNPELINPFEQLAETIKSARAAQQQAEEAATAARGAAALRAVTDLAGAYKAEADTFNERARTWGKLSIFVAVLAALVMGFYVWESRVPNFNAAQAVIRAVVIAGLFGALTLCLRVFESYKHLEVVNRHRVNIGRTFETLKAAQPTDRAKEILSAITAENMLSFGKSGFAPKDSPNQGPLSGATELIKTIVDKSHTP